MSRRVALLIATYSYQDAELSQLISPAHDAEALAAVLKDPDIAGFEVTTLVNQPHHLVGQALGDFYARRRGEDLALVYFTGHGLKDEEGDLYFAMTDTRRDSLLFTALSADHVNRAMDTSLSRQKVLVLDCCYSGAFPPGRTPKADTQVNALERFRGRGRVVLTASDSTQYAFEGNHLTGQGEPSVFTRHFVAGLRTGQADLDNDGDITLDELYAYVYDQVTAEIPRQRPKKLANVEGTIVLARNIHWTPSAPSTPSTSPRSAPSRPAVPLEFPFESAGLDIAGQWLASGRGPDQPDNEVLLWDLRRRRLRHFLTHDHPVAIFALSPAGTWIWTGCEEPSTLQLWDTASGELRHTIVGGHALWWSSSFSPDGSWLATCGEDESAMRLWEVASGELWHVLTHPRPIRSWNFSPDSSWIAAGAEDDAVRVWDVASGRPVSTLVQDRPIKWWSFGPARRWLIIGTANSASQLLDASTGRPATTYFRDGPTTWPRFSPDGRRLATMYPLGGTPGVWVWDVATGARMQIVRVGEEIWEVDFSPTADLLATGTRGGNSPEIWDMATGHPRYSLDYPAQVNNVKFSPDGGTLAALCHAEGSVPLWDAGTGRHLHTLACGAAKNVVTFEFSPDGRLLSTRSWGEENARVWDVATGQLRHTFPHRGLNLARFSEDSRWLTTRGTDTSIVWEL